MTRPSARFLCLVAAASIFLGSCGIFGKQVSLEMTEEDKQQCPPAGILAYAGEVTRFEGNGRTTDDVIERGTISGLKVTCYDTNTGVDATLTFDLSAQSGPRGGGQVALQYFVSIADDNDKPLEKKTFVAYINTAGGHGTVRKYHGVQIPFDIGGVLVDREVIIGLQLSEEELAYNINR